MSKGREEDEGVREEDRERKSDDKGERRKGKKFWSECLAKKMGGEGGWVCGARVGGKKNNNKLKDD